MVTLPGMDLAYACVGSSEKEIARLDVGFDVLEQDLGVFRVRGKTNDCSRKLRARLGECVKVFQKGACFEHISRNISYLLLHDHVLTLITRPRDI